MNNDHNNNDDDDETSPPSRPLLLLVSHARTTSPLPAGSGTVPDLTYDLRAVPTPPKQLRDRFSGVDRRLREHMLAHGDFAALLERAEGDVREAMGRVVAREKEKMAEMDGGRLGAGHGGGRRWRGTRDDAGRKGPGEERGGGTAGGGGGGGGWGVRRRFVRGDDGGEEGGGENGGELEDLDDEERPTLKVGVFCVRGRHRSVAFAEELAQRAWPEEWEVRVVHRDLERSTRKGSLGGKRPFNRRDSLGRGFLDDEDD